MQTAYAQLSLRIRSVWSESTLVGNVMYEP